MKIIKKEPNHCMSVQNTVKTTLNEIVKENISSIKNSNDFYECIHLSNNILLVVDDNFIAKQLEFNCYLSYGINTVYPILGDMLFIGCMNNDDEYIFRDLTDEEIEDIKSMFYDNYQEFLEMFYADMH